MIPKHKRIESKKIRDFARGKDCTVRLPGICNYNPETSVLAHDNGAGWGLKADDYEAAIACSACHDEIDRRTRRLNSETVKLSFYRATAETRRMLFDEGLLKVAV